VDGSSCDAQQTVGERVKLWINPCRHWIRS